MCSGLIAIANTQADMTYLFPGIPIAWLGTLVIVTMPWCAERAITHCRVRRGALEFQAAAHVPTVGLWPRDPVGTIG